MIFLAAIVTLLPSGAVEMEFLLLFLRCTTELWPSNEPSQIALSC